MTAEVLHLKYRPQALEEVIGQDPIVASLASIIERDSSHVFLFIGPSGCGKTTLARIVANSVGCGSADILEVDAATSNGVDDVRTLTEHVRYRPLGAGTARAVILNECQRLSGSAWDALLMATEEPPHHVYWFFTTTEPGKVPKAIVTRSSKFELKPVKWEVLLAQLLQPINEIEGFGVSDKVLGVCARQADGSPRQALVNLSTCVGAQDEKDAATLIRGIEEAEGGPVDLARALVKGTTWAEALKIIATFEDVNPESVRHVVRAYTTKALMSVSDFKRAQRYLAILEQFEHVFNSADGITPVLLAVGRLIRA